MVEPWYCFGGGAGGAEDWVAWAAAEVGVGLAGAEKAEEGTAAAVAAFPT